MAYEIQIYSTSEGKEPFHDWLKSLKDIDTQSLVFQRLQRVRLGNFGDCKSIGEGLWEFRIHHKTGIRVYYARTGRYLILIIGGGDKRSQESDITKARKYLEDYKRRAS